ncbi:MAG: phospholipid carrier-dependent glycosyltransferase [Alphaproteobacteria bacterium]|nr:phospholipid carrier-dependent glycosyltransferase [Alphaproteobacteria bacterium]
MTSSARPDHDPRAWCLALTLAFWLLCLIRLAIPGAPYFDEIHYLPAARELLALGEFTNREHPLLGKQLLALGIALLGDNPWGWRLVPSLFGALALYAAMRALWHATYSRFATLAYGALLATGFLLYVHARIAMLDVFYIAFLALAFWQGAGAMREPETGRPRLALAGIALGLAMAAKWNALVLAPVPGLVFLVMRATAGRRRLLLSRRGAPVPGITLVEAALWLGALPLLVYAASYLPGFWFERGAIGSTTGPAGLIEHHRDMLGMQAGVTQPHPYSSQWLQWLLNARGIWFLYEMVDGAQRGILLIGNPLTMLLGLPALGWAAWRGIARRDGVALAIAGLFVLTLCFWAFADKPVQFYYHYLLPSMFLLAALALALDALWRSGRRWLALLPLAGSLGFFVYFYPILSAAPLTGDMAFLQWAWLPGWR